MSRSGYYDSLGEDDPLALGRWRSAVRNALGGRRGQAFLAEMLVALDALPEKRLITSELETNLGGMPFHRGRGDVCALGAVGSARKIDMILIDPDDAEVVADTFGIADAMSREITWVNDEAGSYRETPEQRFERVRAWVAEHIK